MASKNRISVSVRGATHRRLSDAAERSGTPLSRLTSTMIDQALDELEADPVKASAFCAALVKAAPPSSTIVTQPRRVYVPSAVWFRLNRHRRAQGDFMSNVTMNTEMVEAMLDRAGAK